MSILSRVWKGTVVMAEERVQRRLAAILVADVVGYSRLMEADEVGTTSAYHPASDILGKAGNVSR